MENTPEEYQKLWLEFFREFLNISEKFYKKDYELFHYDNSLITNAATKATEAIKAYHQAKIEIRKLQLTAFE